MVQRYTEPYMDMQTGTTIVASAPNDYDEATQIARETIRLFERALFNRGFKVNMGIEQEFFVDHSEFTDIALAEKLNKQWEEGHIHRVKRLEGESKKPIPSAIARIVNEAQLNQLEFSTSVASPSVTAARAYGLICKLIDYANQKDTPIHSVNFTPRMLVANSAQHLNISLCYIDPADKPKDKAANNDRGELFRSLLINRLHQAAEDASILLCAVPNSYERKAGREGLLPTRYKPGVALDNSVFHDVTPDNEEMVRIEFRTADSAANPYHAVLASMGACYAAYQEIRSDIPNETLKQVFATTPTFPAMNEPESLPIAMHAFHPDNIVTKAMREVTEELGEPDKSAAYRDMMLAQAKSRVGINASPLDALLGMDSGRTAR